MNDYQLFVFTYIFVTLVFKLVLIIEFKWTKIFTFYDA